MKCFRRLLGISYKDHITNKTVKEMDKTGNRTTQSPLNHCKKTAIELVWTRHPFIKISQYDPTGYCSGRRRGRQQKRWEDNISKWTGKRLREDLREAEDRRRLVARASVVPLRST